MIIPQPPTADTCVNQHHRVGIDLEGLLYQQENLHTELEQALGLL